MNTLQITVGIISYLQPSRPTFTPFHPAKRIECEPLYKMQEVGWGSVHAAHTGPAAPDFPAPQQVRWTHDPVQTHKFKESLRRSRKVLLFWLQKIDATGWSLSLPLPLPSSVLRMEGKANAILASWEHHWKEGKDIPEITFLNVDLHELFLDCFIYFMFIMRKINLSY